MRILTGSVLLIILMAVCGNAGTIVYSYDEQHRLAGVNYHRDASQTGPGSDNRGTITYAYDKANNLIEFNVLTDSQYLKPFMLWHSWIDWKGLSERPLCFRAIALTGIEPALLM